MKDDIMPTAVAVDQIRGFLEENFLYGEPFTLGEKESLLAQGILDSTGVLQLVTFLEVEFGITVVDEELVPENLDSLTAILDFLARKRGRRAREGKDGCPAC